MLASLSTGLQCLKLKYVSQYPSIESLVLTETKQWFLSALQLSCPEFLRCKTNLIQQPDVYMVNASNLE